MDWKKIVSAAAPTLGAIASATGPIGALAGAGIVAIGNALGAPMSGDPVKDEQAIEAIVAKGLSPEQTAALVAADLDYKKAMLQAATRDKEIEADVEKAYIGDTDNARKAHAANDGVLRLGYVINVASYLCVAGVLYGCFRLMGAETGIKVEPGTAAMLGSIVGAAVQWLLSNAAQANGFFFGSSPGSRQTAADLGNAVREAIKR